MSEVPSVKIQIEKGLGITHALKKLVEDQKMELSGGKITAQEWNSVMDKLIEIQNNRKANGQASIFGGGTDKTRSGWHNSFVVHPGQEIEFTAEEIGEIYEAMGAKFSNSTPTQAPAPTPVQTPTPVLSDPKVPKKDETPPVTETPPAANTPPAHGKDMSNNKAPLDVEFLKHHKDKAEQTVLNPDGSSYTYDKDGYISDIFDANGNKTREIHRNSDGSINDYCDYEYHPNGERKAWKTYRPDGTLKIIWEFDENGNRVRSAAYEEDGKTPKKK